jgi:RNA polymerase sigma-70 factor (ECF subfamily)
LFELAGSAEIAEVADEPKEAVDLGARFELARDRLVRSAASLVGADAEDVVHDAYLLARRRYEQLRDDAALEPWLTRIVINLCYSRHRRRRALAARLPRLLHRSPADRDVALREMVEQLSARDRTVLVLHYGHGYRLEEIAVLLDLTHTNVRSIIARARKRLFASWRRAEEMDR